MVKPGACDIMMTVLPLSNFLLVKNLAQVMAKSLVKSGIYDVLTLVNN